MVEKLKRQTKLLQMIMLDTNNIELSEIKYLGEDPVYLHLIFVWLPLVKAKQHYLHENEKVMSRSHYESSLGSCKARNKDNI